MIYLLGDEPTHVFGFWEWCITRGVEHVLITLKETFLLENSRRRNTIKYRGGSDGAFTAADALGGGGRDVSSRRASSTATGGDVEQDTPGPRIGLLVSVANIIISAPSSPYSSPSKAAHRLPREAARRRLAGGIRFTSRNNVATATAAAATTNDCDNNNHERVVREAINQAASARGDNPSANACAHSVTPIAVTSASLSQHKSVRKGFRRRE